MRARRGRPRSAGPRLPSRADAGRGVTWIDAELALVSLAAMLSPTTLTFSTFALVLGNRPLRTGFWFYAGALAATLAIGVVAAFVIGDAAASRGSTPKTWVAILDVVAAVALLAFVVRSARRPPNPARRKAMMEQMSKVASAPVAAVVGAGATLANPGGFIPLALKDISETDPSAAGYAIEWLFFALVSLLPLAVALLMLVVAPAWTKQMLEAARRWLERRARTIAFVLLVLIAASLLRNGIAGLIS
jgi:Sap, sulfolipid-1-addressing protein